RSFRFSVSTAISPPPSAQTSSLYPPKRCSRSPSLRTRTSPSLVPRPLQNEALTWCLEPSRSLPTSLSLSPSLSHTHIFSSTYLLFPSHFLPMCAAINPPLFCVCVPVRSAEHT